MTKENSNLRHELWNFTPDLAFQNSSATRPGPLGRYNLAISNLSANGRLVEALRLCAQMNSEGVKPNILTFNSLISACIRDALHAEAWVIYNDMLSFGISPGRDTFHKLLQVR
jgi:pentatricopeptide repeat protein